MGESAAQTRADFARSIYGFVRTLADLLDFVEVTSGLLRKKQQEDVAKSPEAYVQFLLSSENQLSGDAKLEDKFKRDVAAKFSDRFEVVEVERADGEKEIELRAKLGQSIDVRKVAEEIGRSINRQVSLHRSALISLISACEWFTAQILHYFLAEYPDAAGLGERQLTFNELKACDSLDDARSWLIANKIEDILRGSFRDWMSFCFDKLKIQGSGLDEHMPFCQEACLRRNVLVHNGGVVNAIYLKLLPSEISERAKEGDQIQVSSEYFQDRLDRFEIVFIIIALEVWRKLDKRDELRLALAVDLTYSALKEKRWLLARSIGSYVSNQKVGSEAQLLMAKVNYWQSFKWSDNFDAVQPDVENWDVSAKGDLFQLAKDVLLDRDVPAYERITALHAADKLKIEALRDWPLFQDMRKRGVLSRLLENTNPDSLIPKAGLEPGSE